MYFCTEHNKILYQYFCIVNTFVLFFTKMCYYVYKKWRVVSLNRIKELRKKADLSIDQLSLKLKEKGINISASAISKYEREQRKPKIETWQKLADFFGVSVPYLQGIEKYPSNFTKYHEVLHFFDNQLANEKEKYPEQLKILEEIENRLKAGDKKLINYISDNLGRLLPVVYRNFLIDNNEDTTKIDEILKKSATLREALDDTRFIELVYKKQGYTDVIYKLSDYKKYLDGISTKLH